MRLFVALALPAGVVGELDGAVAPLRPEWPGLRWTGTDAWHLTLAFLGEVDEALAPGLGARLERAAARHPSLSLSLAGAGAFPGAARARVLWAGVRGDQRALSALAGSVGAAARRAGAPPASEGRRFHPHLTLARCRAPADVRALVGALASFAGTAWTASEIYLIHSRLQGQPRYQVLGSWPMRPAGSAPGHDPQAAADPGRAGRQGAGERPAAPGGSPEGGAPATGGGAGAGTGPR